MKVARNMARVPCTNRSRVKVRSSRGENWLDASCSVTTVSEKVSDVTVMSELATALSTDRAAPGPPPNRTTLTWGGLYNTYFWIDRRQDLCGVLMTQVLPFYDAAVLKLLGNFERAAYAAFRS